jgi:tRNA (guanine-N7-)-methyltransferase
MQGVKQSYLVLNFNSENFILWGGEFFRNSLERGKTRSKRSGPNEEPLEAHGAIAMGDEEDRSGEAAAERIPKKFTSAQSKLQNFSYPSFCSLFDKEQPTHVEYCSGNGAWIAQKAKENPEINWIAIEMKFDRVRKIWSKMKNFGLKNLCIIWGEGAKVTSEFFFSESIGEVFINFPDPWPKRRHAKNRIIQPSFLDALHRILIKTGKLTFVTDDPDYSQVALNEMATSQKFKNLHPEKGFIDVKEGYGSSYFEELWRSKDKKILHHEFIKVNGN